MTDSVSRVTNAAAAMKQLARIRDTSDPRPELIRTARAAGISWPDIAQAAGLSRVTVITLSKIGAPDTP